MSRTPALATALAAVMVATPTAVANTAPSAPDRHRFEVVSTTARVDTVGRGKGTMQVRVKARYRYSPAQAGELWYGVTTITLRGPGGRKVVRDTDRLVHPGAGQMVDHRVTLSRSEARRVLGPRGHRANLRVRVVGHMEMRGVQRPSELARPHGILGGGVSATVDVTPVRSYPPMPQSWGNYRFWVTFSDTQPYRPYVNSLMVGPQAGVPLSATVLPGTGWLDGAGRFAYTRMPDQQSAACDDFAGYVSGVVPLPSSAGAFPDQPATVQVEWRALRTPDCGNAVRVGPLQLQRDAPLPLPPGF